MSMKTFATFALTVALVATPATSQDLEGPARFCGYSPIIDLLPGERITVLSGGVHGGGFLWEGAFGALEVAGSGWARRPPGRIVSAQTRTQPARFAQRRVNGRHVVAIWNGAQATAYFSADQPLTPAQIQAIRRVTVYQEGERPAGCDLHTALAWEDLASTAVTP